MNIDLLDHVDMHTYVLVYTVSEWYINLRLSFFGVGNFNYEGVKYVCILVLCYIAGSWGKPEAALCL